MQGNPLTWTTYGLISSQLGDVHDQGFRLENGTYVCPMSPAYSLIVALTSVVVSCSFMQLYKPWVHRKASQSCWDELPSIVPIHPSQMVDCSTYDSYYNASMLCLSCSEIKRC